MTTLAERFKEALSERDPPATQADLARACGIKTPSVNGWFQGTTKSIRGKNLLNAARFLGVSDRWLAEGVGSKKRDSDDEIEHVGPAPSTSLLPVAGVAKLGGNGWYSEVVADGSEGYVEHHTRDPGAYVLRVKGDSMYPAIRNGWYVVVEPSMALCGGVYVAISMRDGMKMVKELLYETADEYVLESVNGGERMTISRHDVQSIAGVAAVVAPGKHRHQI